MQDSFDVFEYAAYLRGRWRFIAACSLTAVVLATAISLLLPKRYTATASILIDAPAGNDPRASTAVSPVYLESLKTYETFAESDSLFVRAMDQFKLRDDVGSVSVDSLKRRVLKVTKPRDTKLLEISVTLTDPRKAQAVAQFLAEQTAILSRSLSGQSDDEFTVTARRNVDAARARLEETEKAWANEAGQSPTESLQWELDGLMELKTRLHRELVDANLDSAEYTAQDKAASSSGSDSDAADAKRVRRDLVGTSARVGVLRSESETVQRSIAAKEAALAQRRARVDRLDADRHAARTTFDSATARLNDAQAATGIRGERLRIIDPGIVPQRPTSPNIPLNILGALFVALLASLLYLTAAFSFDLREKSSGVRSAYR
jgi:uncharacterized protein involved in exopolysaccharide biosynthesis